MLDDRVIRDAVMQHGALAVCNAAAAHMSDGRALRALGLDPRCMGDVWQVSQAAHEMMGAAESAAYAADTAVQVAQLGARLARDEGERR